MDGNQKRKPNFKLQLELLEDEPCTTTSNATTMPVDAVLAAESRVGFWITYMAFFLAGAAGVAMWSSITLCLDFFELKYPAERVGFVLPVVNMSTLLVISMYMIVAGRQLPLEARMHGSLVLYLLLVIMLPVVNIVELTEPLAYGLTIVAVILSTACCSVLLSSMYGLAGVFGPYFLQALDGGKGFAAIALFLVRLVTKWYFHLPTSPKTLNEGPELEQFHAHAKVAMAAFFAVTFVIVVGAWIFYSVMRYSEFARPMMDEYLLVQHETPFENATMRSPLASPISPMTPSPTRTGSTSERSPLLPSGLSTTLMYAPSSLTEDTRVYSPPLSPDSELRMEHAASASVLNVLRTAAKPFFSLFWTFFICLSCFPGIIASIASTTYHLGDWFPILLVGSYNVGDLIGKNLPVYVLYFDVSTLHVPWLLQLAFLPLFIIDLLDPFHDLMTVALVLIFGFLTGYVSTSSMILAPSICSEYQKEVAGMVGSLCAIVGLCVGSYHGLALETILQFFHPM